MHKVNIDTAKRLHNKEFRWLKWSILSAIFALLFLVMLPFQPTLTFPDGIIISATGEKNFESKGSEVWVDLESSKFLLKSKNFVNKGWDIRNGQLLSYQNQPNQIISNISFNGDAKLVFSMHPYSGIVDINTDGNVQKYDLYSSSGKALFIKLKDLPGAKIDYVKTLIDFSLYFVSSFFVFLILSFITCKSGRELKNFDDSASIKSKEIFLYSIPSIAIYVVSILTFYPAQMSPDSISQWDQVINGHYKDAHPVLSTLIYSGINHIISGPQWAVLFMSILLALTWGWALSEAICWRVNRTLVIIASILFPLFPPTFLLSSTLWKDIPFGIGLLLMSVISSHLIRRNFAFSPVVILGYIISGLLVFGTRHNGILIIVPYFLFLYFIALQRNQKKITLAILLAQCVVFVLTKTLLISALQAGGIGNHYRSIYGLHVLGAMQEAGVPWNEKEREVISNILPDSAWKDGYRCDTVVTLFWHKDISWKYMGDHYSDINALAFKSIFEHPLIFARHQLCVTSMVWRINPLANEFIAFTPLEITKMPEADVLGLKMYSKLPVFNTYVKNFTANYLSAHSEWVRPAGYLLLGAFLTFILWFKCGWRAMLIFSPALLNSASWILLSGSQDYRYMWPVVLITMYLALLATGRPVHQNKKLPVGG